MFDGNITIDICSQSESSSDTITAIRNSSANLDRLRQHDICGHCGHSFTEYAKGPIVPMRKFLKSYRCIQILTSKVMTFFYVNSNITYSSILHYQEVFGLPALGLVLATCQGCKSHDFENVEI